MKLKNKMGDKKILNVGSGNEIYGTHRIDIIKRPNVTHVVDLEKGLPFPDDFFDEVFARNVFEHLSNPLNFLLEVKRVLKKGGKLKLYTDNGNCIMFVINFVGVTHGNYRYSGEEIDERDMHFQFFQPEHIRNYFWKAGFNRETIKTELLSDYKKEDMKELKPRTIKFKTIRFLLKNILGCRFGCPLIYAEVEK